MAKAFYRQINSSVMLASLSGAEYFRPTPYAAGPWDPRLQHGGPPCALLARSIENLARERNFRHVAHISTLMLRPVPLSDLRVEAVAIKEGKKASHFQASLRSAENESIEYFRMIATCIRDVPVERVPPTPSDAISAPPPWPGTPWQFPTMMFNRPECYGTAFEIHHSVGEYGKGPMKMWVRQRVTTVEGEPATGLQRLLTLGDSANGLSYYVDFVDYSFLNPTLALSVLRTPAATDDWIGISAKTQLNPLLGSGVASAELFDREGRLLGVSTQSLLLQDRETMEN